MSAAVPWVRRAWRQEKARCVQVQRGVRILGGSAAEDVTHCIVETTTVGQGVVSRLSSMSPHRVQEESESQIRENPQATPKTHPEERGLDEGFGSGSYHGSQNDYPNNSLAE